jgi:hypothetical protein
MGPVNFVSSGQQGGGTGEGSGEDSDYGEKVRCGGSEFLWKVLCVIFELYFTSVYFCHGNSSHLGVQVPIDLMTPR